MDERPQSFLQDFIFPSGDVTQLWSLWNQYMPITINNMNSSDPGKELRIIKDAASYGKQLGRIIETLEVLIKHTEMTDFTKEDTKTFEDFTGMADEIAAVKNGMKAPTEKNLENIISTIRYWKAHNMEYFEKVRYRLKHELNED
jgi:hypothetical protein